MRYKAIDGILVGRMRSIGRHGGCHGRFAGAHKLALTRRLARWLCHHCLCLGLLLLSVCGPVRFQLPNLPLVRSLGQILKILSECGGRTDHALIPRSLLLFQFLLP